MRLTFLMGFDMRMGRGGENVLFNLLKYTPNDIEVTVLETDLIDRARKTDDAIRSLGNKHRFLKIHTFNYFTNGLMGQFYRDVILRTSIKDLKNARKTEVFKQIRETDLAYLFYNYYAIFFQGMGIPVIASPHSGEVLIIGHHRSFVKRVIYSIYHPLYYGSINGYHAFPKNRKDLEGLDLKYKMCLPNGVDTDRFHPDDDAFHERIRFLFIAALLPEKGLDILLPLIESIKDDSVEFHIAGTGPLEDEIRKNKRIIYHGALNDDDLARLYRECDVFIYPSHSDSFGLVVLEALSSGLYVLAGDYLRGNFDDFEGKYLEYIPMNVDSFHRRVMDIVRDRKIIEHDKREEYDYMKKNYDWSVMTEKFYGYMRQFYEESKLHKKQYRSENTAEFKASQN